MQRKLFFDRLHYRAVESGRVSKFKVMIVQAKLGSIYHLMWMTFYVYAHLIMMSVQKTHKVMTVESSEYLTLFFRFLPSN